MFKKSTFSEYIIVSGEKKNSLAESIAKKLEKKVVYPTVTTFANGEQKLQLNATIRKKKVLLIHPLTPPVDTNFVRGLLLLSALEHMSVSDIILVIPWMGYSLQDRIFLPGEPLSSEVIAESLSRKSVSQVLLIDVHKHVTCDHFLVPAVSMDVTQYFVKQIRKSLGRKSILVVSPDNGGCENAQRVSELLAAPFAFFDKKRDRITGEIVSKTGQIIERESAEVAVIYDDGILSGSTIIAAAEQLRGIGFSDIYVFTTHGLLLNDALEKMASVVTKIYVSNTIERAVELAENGFSAQKLEILDLSDEVLTTLEKLVK